MGLTIDAARKTNNFRTINGKFVVIQGSAIRVVLFVIIREKRVIEVVPEFNGPHLKSRNF